MNMKEATREGVQAYYLPQAGIITAEMGKVCYGLDCGSCK